MSCKPRRCTSELAILAAYDRMTPEQQAGFLRLAFHYALRSCLRIIPAASCTSSSSTSIGKLPINATKSSRD